MIPTTPSVVLPPPMHAVNAPQHPGKPSLLVDIKQASCVLLIRSTKVLIAKSLNDGSNKPPHALDDGALPKPEALIKEICRSIECQHSKYRCHLLQRRQS